MPSSRIILSLAAAAEFDVDNAVALKKALKKGVESGKLVMMKSSYMIAGVEQPGKGQHSVA